MAVDLTGRISPRLILGLAAPLFALSLFDRAYVYINMACLGRLGASALAAVIIAGTYAGIIGSLTAGFNRSVLHFISHEAGRKNYEAASRWLSQAFVWSLLFGLLFSFVQFIFRRPLISLISVDNEVLGPAVDYFAILAFLPILNFPRNTILASLRGDGDTRTPMKIGAAQNLITGGLDIVLIFGLLGFPNLGVRGAAVATLIGQTAAVLAFIAFSRRRDHRIRLRFSYCREAFAPAFLGRFFRHLLPSLGEALVRGCNRFFIVKIIAPYGAPALAAFRVAESICGFFQMAGSQSLTVACSAIAGQNFGAERPDNVKRTLLLSNKLYLYMALPGALLFNLCPQFFIGLFVSEPAVIAEGALYLRFLSVSLLFAGFISTGDGVLNVGGRASAVMLISLFGNYLIQIPAAYLLSRFTPLGLTGVWLADPLTYLVQTVAVLWLLNRYFFSKSPIHFRRDLMWMPFYDSEP